jgi:hypothetical protein
VNPRLKTITDPQREREKGRNSFQPPCSKEDDTAQNSEAQQVSSDSEIKNLLSGLQNKRLSF